MRHFSRYGQRNVKCCANYKPWYSGYHGNSKKTFYLRKPKQPHSQRELRGMMALNQTYWIQRTSVILSTNTLLRLDLIWLCKFHSLHWALSRLFNQQLQLNGLGGTLKESLYQIWGNFMEWKLCDCITCDLMFRQIPTLPTSLYNDHSSHQGCLLIPLVQKPWNSLA